MSQYVTNTEIGSPIYRHLNMLREKTFEEFLYSKKDIMNFLFKIYLVKNDVMLAK